MIAFVHVAKTGGRTIESLLRSAYGAAHCDASLMKPHGIESPEKTRFTIPKFGPQEIRQLKSIMPGMRSLGGHHVALWSGVEEVVPEVQYLLFLREPLKRGASHYQFHVTSDDYTSLYGFKHFEWDQWVGWETHHNHQIKMLSPNVDVNEAIRLIESKRAFVGLMEHFDESLVLFQKLFAPDLRIAYRRKNTARDNTIARSLLADPKKCDQIREMYDQEFPLYEWVVHDLFPKYRREYGPRLAEDLARYQEHGRDQVSNLNLLKYHAYRRLFYLPRVKRLQQRNAREE